MRQEMMQVTNQVPLAEDIFEMTLQGELVAEMRQPGQFLHLRVPRYDMVLRRPISVARIESASATCKIIYRVQGKGTNYLSRMKKGDRLDVLGPLGVGFDLSFLQPNKPVFVIGGGIGVAPLYELAKQIARENIPLVQLFGFANKAAIYYEQNFSELGSLHLSTDDGSYQHKGHVGQLVKQALEKHNPQAVYACGPEAMLKCVDHLFISHPHAYISLESHMACGIGACYACVRHLQNDASQTKSVKVCEQGPVFPTGFVMN